VSPILGIYASQISGHLFAPSGAYDSIATTTVGSGGVSSVTFSSIPSTYTHLQIRGIAKTNRATFTNDLIAMRFNGDTGNNYTSHTLQGTGAIAVSAALTNSSRLYYTSSVGSTAMPSQTFGAVVIDILDYTNTNKNTTVRTLGGFDNNGNGSDPGIINLDSGVFLNTNAITSITLLPAEGSLLAENTTLALYGIKGN
jgi:hypothetical protein